MAYDMINWAGKLTLLVALGLGVCFMMLEKKRGPLGLTLLALCVALCAGQIVKMQDGRTATQHYIQKLLKHY